MFQQVQQLHAIIRFGHHPDILMHRQGRLYAGPEEDMVVRDGYADYITRFVFLGWVVHEVSFTGLDERINVQFYCESASFEIVEIPILPTTGMGFLLSNRLPGVYFERIQLGISGRPFFSPSGMVI